MNCIHCGRQSDYHRAVHEVATGLDLGALCARCERERLGELPDTPSASGRTCVECGDHADYALPEHSMVFDDRGDGERRVEGFLVTDDTPRVCWRHLSGTDDARERAPIPLVDAR